MICSSSETPGTGSDGSGIDGSGIDGHAPSYGGTAGGDRGPAVGTPAVGARRVGPSGGVRPGRSGVGQVSSGITWGGAGGVRRQTSTVDHRRSGVAAERGAPAAWGAAGRPPRDPYRAGRSARRSGCPWARQRGPGRPEATASPGRTALFPGFDGVPFRLPRGDRVPSPGRPSRRGPASARGC
ncbi:hypothetical protein GCM10010515_28490 [Streptomyces fructofermentans]|uniref:Uncharacterized protein n=1 Tax=Streptomyces fructofermentans TaxID=152141 RepID=A0A918KD17_9ACTN|nr:hypothetical protein GCM10010515_28490 [Streptomyces fructofermentans]